MEGFYETISTEISTNVNSEINNLINTNINTDFDSNISANNNNYLLSCDVSIININDSIIDNKAIKKYINNYFKNISTYKRINHYINKKEKLSITISLPQNIFSWILDTGAIFKDWSCTNNLLKYGFFELNIGKIFNKLEHLKNSDYFLYILC